jgi:ribonuclease HII
VALTRPIAGLKDSKVLSRLQRSKLAKIVEKQAACIGLGWVWPEEIDVLGLTKATTLAMERSLAEIWAGFSEIIIDGHFNYLGNLYKERPCTTLIRADTLVPAVSAASIIAKVARDNYMIEQALRYEKYGFDTHVGYGTLQHRLALAEQGLTPLHRRSYKPIQAIL